MFISRYIPHEDIIKIHYSYEFSNINIYYYLLHLDTRIVYFVFRHIVLIYKLSSLLDFLINEPKFLNYLPVTYFVPFLFYYEFVKILQRMIYKKGEGNLRETCYYPMYIFLEFEFPSLTHYRMMGDPSFKKSVNPVKVQMGLL